MKAGGGHIVEENGGRWQIPSLGEDNAIICTCPWDPTFPDPMNPLPVEKQTQNWLTWDVIQLISQLNSLFISSVKRENGLDFVLRKEGIHLSSSVLVREGSSSSIVVQTNWEETGKKKTATYLFIYFGSVIKINCLLVSGKKKTPKTSCSEGLSEANHVGGKCVQGN